MFFLCVVFGRLPRTLELSGTGTAGAIDIQAIMIGIKRIKATGIHECSEIGVSHLLDLTTVSAYQMGVRQGNAFILCLHSFKHMTPQHLGIH